MVGFFRSGVCWGEGMLDLPGIIQLPILVIKWGPILGKIKLDVNMLLVNLLDLHPQPVANSGYRDHSVAPKVKSGPHFSSEKIWDH